MRRDFHANGHTAAAAAATNGRSPVVSEPNGAATANAPTPATEPLDSAVMRELREVKAMLKSLLGAKGVDVEYLDARTLAKKLGISVTTLYRQVTAGELPPPEKFGSSSRWKWADVEDAIARRK